MDLLFPMIILGLRLDVRVMAVFFFFFFLLVSFFDISCQWKIKDRTEEP